MAPPKTPRRVVRIKGGILEGAPKRQSIVNILPAGACTLSVANHRLAGSGGSGRGK